MQKINRRGFLKGTLATAAVMLSHKHVLGANEDIRVAVVGFNSRGKDHIEGFRKLPGVRVAALCDVDKDVLVREAKKFEDRNEKVETFTDVRQLLERKDIDVISTATPNHWHALIAIWACQAGKDVYVEKPVSHNVWEGRKIVEAARKYGRVVQTGTQSRSSPGLHETVQYIRDGHLGKIKLVRGLCYKRRASIGKTSGEQKLPGGLDYDMWAGPAPLSPLNRTRLHYDWHWVWQTGNGDLGNQGIHQMDIARWVLGVNELSPRVLSVGGRFGYEDDGQTPNTLSVFHEYEPAPLYFEVRGLPAKALKPNEKADKKSDEMDNYHGASIGVIAHCEGGTVVIPSYTQGIVYDKDDKKIKTFDGGGDHYANFIKAVRSRKSAELNAEILEGHLSSALCHTANISYRLGQSQPQTAVAEALKDNAEARETFGRMQEHLGVHGIQGPDVKFGLGAWLKMDPKLEKFIENEKANEMLNREYRKPFVVPESV